MPEPGNQSLSGEGKARRIGFYPGVGNNSYTQSMQSSLPEGYHAVLFPRIKLLALYRFFRVLPRVDVVLVSWLENCLINRHTGKRRLFGSIVFRYKLMILRLFSRRVVMVRHNNFPHSALPEYQNRIRQQIDVLERSFDAVITHSGHQTEGRYYVPHPLYNASFPDSRVSPMADCYSDGYCVAFGRISRYKNLWALITAWNGPNQLVIAGKADDVSYLESLKKAAVNNKFVTIEARYWSDDEAVALVSGAASLVLAHEGNDVVVSGSYFYAVSCGTPVVALSTQFLAWLEQQSGPAITTVGTVDELARLAGKVSSISKDERIAVHRQGVEWFGDDVVRQHLKALFDDLF